jgi:hypothetical protein
LKGRARNLLDKNIHIINRNTKALLVASKEFGGLAQNDHMKIENKYFEKMVKFKYFGMTLTNLNCMCEEVKSRLELGNAWYCLLQSLLSLHFAVGENEDLNI